MRFTSGLRRVQVGRVLALAGLLALPLEVFSWPSVTPVMVGAALLALAAGSWRRQRPPFWLTAALVLLLLDGIVSASWSLSPFGSLELALMLLGAFVAGLVVVDAARGLTAEEREVCGRGLALGYALGLVLLVVMFLTQARAINYLRDLAFLAPLIGHQRAFYFPVGFDPAMTLVVLLAWPVLRFVGRRFGALAASLLAIVAFVVVIRGESMTAKVAFLLGIAVFLAARHAPRLASWAIGSALILWLVAAPYLMRPQVLSWLPAELPIRVVKEHSLEHRLAIWGFAIERIDDRPLFGWGIDSSRWMPGGHEVVLKSGELLPLHPHDAALQLWLDLGLPGVLLGVVIVAGIMRAVAAGRADPEDTATALAFIVATAVFAALSYDLWHVWWQTMIWLGAAFVLAGMRAGPAESAT